MKVIDYLYNTEGLGRTNMIELTDQMIAWVLDAEKKFTQDPTMKFEIEFDLPNIRTAERLYDLALEHIGA